MQHGMEAGEGVWSRIDASGSRDREEDVTRVDRLIAAANGSGFTVDYLEWLSRGLEPSAEAILRSKMIEIFPWPVSSWAR